MYADARFLKLDAKHLISRLITVNPKDRATLQEVMAHPWVNEGYNYPPPNYIPERPAIQNPSLLSKDTINRLLIFGYKIEDIHKAFSPEEDFGKPHPIRSTYYLLSEMVAREQAKMKKDRKRHETQPNSIKQKAASLQSLTGSSTQTLVGDNLSSQFHVPSQPARTHGLLAASQEHGSSSNIQPPPHAHVAHHNSTRSSPIKPQLHFHDYSNFHTSMPIIRQPEPQPDPNLDNTNYGTSIAQAAASHLQKWYSVPSNIYQTIADSTSALLGSATTSQMHSKQPSSYQAPSPNAGSVFRWSMHMGSISTKPPRDLISQLCTILKKMEARWHFETEFRVCCQVDAKKFLGPKALEALATQAQDIEAMDLDPVSSLLEAAGQIPPSGTIVTFQIEVCKLPNNNQTFGLYFKRLNGGVWNYKRVCNRLMAEMKF
jgi:serine/threonine protein kinase